MCERKQQWEQIERGQRDSHSLAHTVFSSFFIIFNITSNFQRLNCEALTEMGMTGLFNMSKKIFQHVACELVK